MIRTRIVVGLALAFAVVAILVVDRFFAPWYPFLFAGMLALGCMGGLELVSLFPERYRPSRSVAIVPIVAIIVANWYPLLAGSEPTAHSISAWSAILFVFIAGVGLVFLHELWRYREPGTAVIRLGLTVLTIVYLGLLGSFFTQIRWLGDPLHSSLLLALCILVPKWGDVGAFFTGTFLGRHKMTPILSPKKTWEGFAGGMVAAVLAAIGMDALANAISYPIFRYGISETMAFGLAIGIAGVLGDLAESLIKRDCQMKDAAQSIPGFGGLLDVIDSILFAAPPAYFWLSRG